MVPEPDSTEVDENLESGLDTVGEVDKIPELEPTELDESLKSELTPVVEMDGTLETESDPVVNLEVEKLLLEVGLENSLPVSLEVLEKAAWPGVPPARTPSLARFNAAPTT